MTNLNLIKKLNSLQKIKPSDKWLSDNRELLLSQISNSGAESLSAWKILIINLKSFSQAASKPVYALGVFALLLVTGALFSQKFLVQVQPTDSLYIARIMSEKVKIGTTLNSQDRDKLAAHYALGHAQDISSTLANPQFNIPANKEQVAKLDTDFNEEIQTAKSHLNNLQLSSITKSNSENSETLSSLESQDSILTGSSSQSDLGDLVIADSYKDDQGISLVTKIQDEDLNETDDSQLATNSELVVDTDSDLIPSSTTSTLEVVSPILSSSSSVATDDELNSDYSSMIVIVEEAEELHNSQKYTEATDKLKEVDIK
jgi:hypothetical protein